MFEPLTSELPYPTLDGICRDAYSLKIVSPAYASPQGELTAILQYVYHAGFFRRHGLGQAAEVLSRISVCEMQHLNILANTIAALGAAPVYTRYPPDLFDFYSTKYVSYSGSLKHMLEDDILGERRSIYGYEKMLGRLKNAAVANVIEKLLADERVHLEELEKLRAQI